jgi:predicted DsbA family dithiol-disulfide isomerase
MEISQEEHETRPRAALTIVFHSWTIPIVGVVMLVLDLMRGYFARRLTASFLPESVTAQAASAAPPANGSAFAQSEPAQKAFWEYHDLLFDHQAGENGGAFNKDNLKRYASELGLDTIASNECLDSSKYTLTVDTETSTAQLLGVRTPPGFQINGKPLVGAQGFEVFKQYIDEALTSEK